MGIYKVLTEKQIIDAAVSVFGKEKEKEIVSYETEFGTISVEVNDLKEE